MFLIRHSFLLHNSVAVRSTLGLSLEAQVLRAEAQEAIRAARLRTRHRGIRDTTIETLKVLTRKSRSPRHSLRRATSSRIVRSDLTVPTQKVTLSFSFD